MNQTIQTSTGTEVSFSPEKGGLITSLKIRGTEVLYQGEDRGGIPILFPNAGIVVDPRLPNLKRHGFARDSKDWQSVVTDTGFKEILHSNKESYELYPYDFKLSIEGAIQSDGSMLLRQSITNTSMEKELPIATGLHPYFKVPAHEKKNILFNFDGGALLKEQCESWANGETVIIDNPKLKDPNAVINITIPTLGTLIIDASSEYQKIWVWSLPEKDFICIEPSMRDIGGLITDPYNIAPGENVTAQVYIDLI